MKIVVTGSVGRLGSRVAVALAEAGHDVVASDVRRLDNSPESLRVVDLCKIDAVRELVKGADVVCHLGNLPGTIASGRSAGFINNASANYNVFLAATEAGVRHVVYASSIHAYGVFGFASVFGPGVYSKPRYLPLDEEHPRLPVDAYALSKVVGEQIAESFCLALPDLTVWSLRYTGIRMPFPAAVSPPASAGPSAPVTPRPPHPPHSDANRLVMAGSMSTAIHVNDAARATVLACERKRPGHTPVNVVAPASRKPWTLDQLRDSYGEVPVFKRPVAPTESLISPDLARELLGFVATEP